MSYRHFFGKNYMTLYSKKLLHFLAIVLCSLFLFCFGIGPILKLETSNLNTQFVKRLSINAIIQCVREILHVFDYNFKENALRKFDTVFCSLKFHLSHFVKYPIFQITINCYQIRPNTNRYTFDENV